MHSVHLSDKQLSRLSEICGNFSLVCFGSFVIPVFVGIDNVDQVRVIWGVVLTFVALAFSLWLERK